MQTFVAALDTMFGGFRERADDTYPLLKAPGTAFLVVAAPEPDALREASYFVERLAAEQMPLAGLVVNRVHSHLVEADGRSGAAAGEPRATLEQTPSHARHRRALLRAARRAGAAGRGGTTGWSRRFKDGPSDGPRGWRRRRRQTDVHDLAGPAPRSATALAEK